MAQAKTLDQMLDDAGYPPEVRRMVEDGITEHNTADLIKSGVSALPHPSDAQAHYDRKEAEAGRKKINAADQDTVKALQDRLAALEAALHAKKDGGEQEESDKEDKPTPKKGAK